MSISIVVEHNSLIVRCQSDSLNADDAQTCIEACRRDGNSQAPVVLDFTRVHTASPEALRKLASGAQELERISIKLVLLAHRDFISLISAQGMERHFHCFIQAQTNEPEVKTSFAEMSREVAVFLEECTTAVNNTLKTYAKLGVRPGVPYAHGADALPHIEIAGNVGLIGNNLVGTFTLGFPLATFFGIVSRIYGKPIAELDAETKDWAGELVNVALGQIKTSLNTQGYGLQPAVPTVVLGNELEFVRMKNCSVTVLPFESDAGRFWAFFAIPTDSRSA